MTAVLETERLSASYGMLEVLHDISLRVERGGVTVLLGANGAGKTTVLRAICNLMVKTRGAVYFEGKPIQGKPTEAIASLGISHVPDGRGTFVHLTVEENLELALILGRTETRLLRIRRVSTAIFRD